MAFQASQAACNAPPHGRRAARGRESLHRRAAAPSRGHVLPRPRDRLPARQGEAGRASRSARLPARCWRACSIGQLGVQVSGEVKQCFFLLFLFSIGFRTGPQFFRGLRSDGLQQAALAAIIATTGLVVAYVVSRLFGYDAGHGRRASSRARSPSPRPSAPRATRSRRCDCRRPTRPRMINRIPVAFAVTYLIGVVGAAWFLAQLAPRLMGVDLEEECRRYEQRDAGRREPSRRARRENRVSRLRRAAGIAVGRAAGPASSRSRERRAPVRRADPARRRDSRDR